MSLPLVIAIGVFASAVLGVVIDWLLKPLLPERPRLKHGIAGITAIVVLLLVIAYATGQQSAEPTTQPFTSIQEPDWPKQCRIVFEEGVCVAVFEQPSGVGSDPKVACLGNGLPVEVVEEISFLVPRYHIVYSYESGPVTVTEIMLDSPAEEIGLKVGDVFISVDGIPVPEPSSLSEYMHQHAGETVLLVIQRNGQTLALKVIPRVSPPEGQGPVGFKVKGGLKAPVEGYITAWDVSCVEVIK